MMFLDLFCLALCLSSKRGEEESKKDFERVWQNRYGGQTVSSNQSTYESMFTIMERGESSDPLLQGGSKVEAYRELANHVHDDPLMTREVPSNVWHNTKKCGLSVDKQFLFSTKNIRL